MARKKKEDPPKGSPAWMNTFSDLMNLLLCFFVLLFSMSSVEEDKFQALVASFQNTFSILPNGGSAIGEGTLISSGVSQLEMLDAYYKDKANSESDEESDDKDVTEAYREQELSESEKMAEEIEDAINKYGISDEVDVSFNAEYVLLNMNGALLFDSGKAEVKSEAYPLIDKLGKVIQKYDKNIIEVEGHTDNVPISGGFYKNNMWLSTARATEVFEYFVHTKKLKAKYLEPTGRAAYEPVASNKTQKGRAQNRRVEIKIYTK